MIPTRKKNPHITNHLTKKRTLLLVFGQTPPFFFSCKPRVVMSLVSPPRYMKRVGAESTRSLAITVYKKLQIMIDPKSETTDNYLKSGCNLFQLAFNNPVEMSKITKEVQERLDKMLPELGIEGEPFFRMLPPLFLLSEERFMTVYDDILLFAFRSGPIIPVVDLQRIREKNILDQLIVLYSKSSKHYMNVDTIRDVLTPPQQDANDEPTQT